MIIEMLNDLLTQIFSKIPTILRITDNSLRKYTLLELNSRYLLSISLIYKEDIQGTYSLTRLISLLCDFSRKPSYKLPQLYITLFVLNYVM